MADLYVMPSVSEPFGIAPLEALNYDVPVLISKQSGVSNMITTEWPDLQFYNSKFFNFVEKTEFRIHFGGVISANQPAVFADNR